MSGYGGYHDFSQGRGDWSGYDQGYGGYDGYGGGGGGWGGWGGGYDQGYGYNEYGGGYGRTIDNYMPRDCSDCIFVTGVPSDATKEELSDHFCRAGTILVTKGVQRIFCFMDKMKQPTGECTVTYENPDAAMRAIEMFDGKDFNSKGTVTVAIATPEQKQPFASKLLRDAQKNGGGGGGGGRGGYGGGYGGGRGRGRGGGFRGRGGPRGGGRGGGFRGGRGRGRPAPY